MAQYVILPSWEELRRYKTQVILGGIQFHKMTKMTDVDEEQFCGWFLDLHDLTKYASAQINYWSFLVLLVLTGPCLALQGSNGY